MISILLNEKKVSLTCEIHLQQVLLKHANINSSFAVAVNKTFIPRALHATTILQDGDIVEIIMPMQGG